MSLIQYILRYSVQKLGAGHVEASGSLHLRHLAILHTQLHRLVHVLVRF